MEAERRLAQDISVLREENQNLQANIKNIVKNAVEEGRREERLRITRLKAGQAQGKAMSDNADYRKSMELDETFVEIEKRRRDSQGKKPGTTEKC